MDGQVMPPDPYDTEGLTQYWTSLGFPWRRESEIPEERQARLNDRRSLLSDPSKGEYPFMGLTLTRADVEWLIATSEGTPVDLRGAVLTDVDLSELPLRDAQLGRADLGRARLNGADLSGAHLTEAYLIGAKLDEADLSGAHLERAALREASLKLARLDWAHLEDAFLDEATLDKAVLRSAHLERTSFRDAHLAGIDGHSAHFEEATLTRCDCSEANLRGAHFDGADLTGVNLRNVDMRAAYISNAILAGVNIRGALLADIRWDSVNIAGINWPRILGDEVRARRRLVDGVERRTRARGSRRERQAQRRQDQEAQVLSAIAAARAYRGLLQPLRDAGLRAVADGYTYRALQVERLASLRAGQRLEYLFSLLFDLTTGYGYRIERLIVTYALFNLLFSIGYYLLSQTGDVGVPSHMSLSDANLFSIQVILNGSLPASSSLPLSNYALNLFDFQRVFTIVYGFILSNVMSRRIFGT